MKKRLIPLFTMSILSIITSLLSLYYAITMHLQIDELSEETAASETAVDDVLFLFGGILFYFVIVMFIIAFAASILPGIFGLICSLTKGRFAVLCVILGISGSVISVIAIISMIIDGSFSWPFIIPLVYFIIYTASSLIAYKYRKSQTALNVPHDNT